MLVYSPDSQCDDGCKSCKHWTSEPVHHALYSTHFATDKSLTTAQMSATAAQAVGPVTAFKMEVTLSHERGA